MTMLIPQFLPSQYAITASRVNGPQPRRSSTFLLVGVGRWFSLVPQATAGGGRLSPMPLYGFQLSEVVYITFRSLLAIQR